MAVFIHHLFIIIFTFTVTKFKIIIEFFATIFAFFHTLFLHNFRFVTNMISYFFLNYIHLILIYCLSTCFCNQHPVNLLLHCFLCIFIEMITDNIDCLPDFLCKCVTLCFCIHHFFHNHFSFLLEPQQRVIPLVSVRTLFFKSGPKWALPVSQATYI